MVFRLEVCGAILLTLCDLDPLLWVVFPLLELCLDFIRFF